MENVLIGIKNEMIQNKKLAQPADGDMYWGWPSWSFQLRLFQSSIRMQLFNLDSLYSFYT